MSRGMRIWDPWRDLDQMLTGSFGDLLSGPRRTLRMRQQTTLPVNFWRSDDSLVLQAEIPGLDIEQMDLTVTGERLTLKGQRTVDMPEEGETYQRRERPTQGFSRTFALPYEVDPNKTEATYENGVLTISLHRPDHLKPQKIQIKAQ